MQQAFLEAFLHLMMNDIGLNLSKLHLILWEIPHFQYRYPK